MDRKQIDGYRLTLCDLSRSNRSACLAPPKTESTDQVHKSESSIHGLQFKSSFHGPICGFHLWNPLTPPKL